ncbi:MAG: amidase [Pyrinomonadaceae bacterium]
MGVNRREFIGAGLAGGTLLAMSGKSKGASNKSQKFDIEEKTVVELQKAMSSGEITSAGLVSIYLQRIKEIDPKLNSIIEVNPDAIRIAETADAERKAGRVRSPLHGIPFVVKDNLDTADKMRTTAGSLALVDAPKPKKDSHVVRLLRESGAVLIGKTNLSEWANFRSDNSSSGWSGVGGQTHNPYILDRSPCGSSSGSGASIAANLAAIAVGTETDGSVVCPSSINGIVGIKPTLGLVSRSGIIPIAHSQDTAGPMCRTVADAAALLNVMSGADPEDEITVEGAKRAEKDYTAFLKADSVRGMKLGVVRKYFGRNKSVDGLMESALSKLKEMGAELVDVEMPGFGKTGEDEYQVLLYEFKADLNKYLANRGGKHKSIADLIEFNEANKARSMPYFGQDIFEAAEEKGPLTEMAYKLALMRSKFFAQDQGIDYAHEKYGIDALVAPSNAQTWLIDLVNGDNPREYVGSSSMPAVAGYPNITVPAGFLNKLPIGISFFGKAFSEGKLISIAYAWEQATKARRKPEFLPTYM